MVHRKYLIPPYPSAHPQPLAPCPSHPGHAVFPSDRDSIYRLESLQHVRAWPIIEQRRMPPTERGEQKLHRNSWVRCSRSESASFSVVFVRGRCWFSTPVRIIFRRGRARGAPEWTLDGTGRTGRSHYGPTLGGRR
jgi:hypothetical protein